MLFSVDGKWQAHSSSLPRKPSDAQHTNLIFLQHQSTTKHCYKIEAQWKQCYKSQCWSIVAKDIAKANAIEDIAKMLS
jgi:hypothetical protein